MNITTYLSCVEKKTPLKQIYENGKERIHEEFDIVSIIRKLRSIESILGMLLGETEVKLIPYMKQYRISKNKKSLLDRFLTDINKAYSLDSLKES